jgi:hypothetical protein
VQAHRRRLGGVKEISRHGLAHIGAQFFTIVALRKNVVGKTLGHKTAIVFLREAEDNFHNGTIEQKWMENKPFAAAVKSQRGVELLSNLHNPMRFP